jgi:hypothetical protein
MQPKVRRRVRRIDVETRWAKVKAQILADADLLGTQGTFCRKSDGEGTSFRLRYVDRRGDGKAVHRAIGLTSNPELLRRTKELLERCHQRGARVAEVESLRRTSEVLVGLLRKAISKRQDAKQEKATGSSDLGSP